MRGPGSALDKYCIGLGREWAFNRRSAQCRDEVRKGSHGHQTDKMWRKTRGGKSAAERKDWEGNPHFNLS